MFKVILFTVLAAAVAVGVRKLLKSGVVADVESDVSAAKAAVSTDVADVKADVAAVKAKV